jgi:hypothetical protein
MAEARSYRDTEFRREMIVYIRQHFSDLLGEHVSLLDREGGLDEIWQLIQSGKIRA